MDYGLSIYLYIGFFDSEKVCIKNNISKINEQRKSCKVAESFKQKPKGRRKKVLL